MTSWFDLQGRLMNAWERVDGSHVRVRAAEWLETDEDSFWYALECMPPRMWVRNPETFIMGEPWAHTAEGKVVGWVFARVKDRYFVTLASTAEYEDVRALLASV